MEAAVTARDLLQEGGCWKKTAAGGMAMAKEYVLDMTKGNETSLLLRFTLPMLVGNIFSSFIIW